MRWKVTIDGPDPVERIHETPAAAWREYDALVTELVAQGFTRASGDVVYGRRWEQVFLSSASVVTLVLTAAGS